MLFLQLKMEWLKNKLIDVAKSGKRELRDSGKVSIKLDEKDELIGVKLCT